MKKLVFTAIAMVAFCGVSMANTIEVKVEVVPAKETIPVRETATTTKKEDLLRTPCDALWITAWQLYGGANSGHNGLDAITLADEYASYHGC